MTSLSSWTLRVLSATVLPTLLMATLPLASAGAAPALPAAGPQPQASSGQGSAWHARSPGWSGRHGTMQRFGQGSSWQGHGGRWAHGHDGRRWAGRHGWGRGGFSWGAFDTGWTAFAPGWTAPGWADAIEPPFVPFDLDDRPRLPTAADLPVGGLRPTPVGPAVLYDIRDLSHGRSGNPGGARIVSASEPRPLPGSSPGGSPGQGGPLIIHLTAR